MRIWRARRGSLEEGRVSLWGRGGCCVGERAYMVVTLGNKRRKSYLQSKSPIQFNYSALLKITGKQEGEEIHLIHSFIHSNS